MNLWPIAVRSTLIVVSLSFICSFVWAIFLRPIGHRLLGGEIIMGAYFGMLCFWTVVWCLSPKRWWKLPWS